MTRAIFYRHWLEIRFRLMIAAVVLVPLCLFYLGVAANAGGPGISPSVAHTWLAGAVALFVGLLFGGTGVRASFMAPGHPSLYYALTLPASRLALIWTQQVIAFAAAVGLLAAMLTLNCLALLATGQSVPLGAMAAASCLAALVALALQAVLGLLIPLGSERLGPMAVAAVLGAVIISVGHVNNDNTDAWTYGWTPTVTGFISSQPVPWRGVWTLALIVAASTSIATLIARRRDF